MKMFEDLPNTFIVIFKSKNYDKKSFIRPVTFWRKCFKTFFNCEQHLALTKSKVVFTQAKEWEKLVATASNGNLKLYEIFN